MGAAHQEIAASKRAQRIYNFSHYSPPLLPNPRNLPIFCPSTENHGSDACPASGSRTPATPRLFHLSIIRTKLGCSQWARVRGGPYLPSNSSVNSQNTTPRVLQPVCYFANGK